MAPFLETKKGKRQWENLENLLPNLTANKLPKKNNYSTSSATLLCYVKTLNFVTAIPFRGKVF